MTSPFLGIDIIFNSGIFNSTTLMRLSLSKGRDGEEPLEFPLEVPFSFENFLSLPISSGSLLFWGHLKQTDANRGGKYLAYGNAVGGFVMTKE